MSPSGSSRRPPSWAVEPLAAWIYLAATIALAFTPLLPITGLASIVAAIFTFQDRKTNGFPAFWWTVGVAVLGPLVYIFYVYQRPQPPTVYSPEAVMSQQALHAPGRAATIERPSPAGWYSDPSGNARIRYWDGTHWTEHTAE